MRQALSVPVATMSLAFLFIGTVKLTGQPQSMIDPQMTEYVGDDASVFLSVGGHYPDNSVAPETRAQSLTGRFSLNVFFEAA